MNNTIILNQLSETISTLTGSSVEEAEAFVCELSALVAERLESEGQVEVPGLGTFVVTDETVAFAPDKEIAEAVNAPFAAFEAIEMPEGLASEDEQIAAAAEFEQEELAEELAPEPAPEAAPEPAPADEVAPIVIPEYKPAQKIEDEPTEEVKPPKKGHITWPWWLIGCIVCFIAGYILGAGSEGESEGAIEETPAAIEIAEPIDSIEPEPAEIIEPTPQVYQQITDTVTSLKFLTTMARKHYGHTDFWPYIYEANAAKLGNPERLSAGTVVVIPPADSLKLDPQNAEQLAIARQKAAAIYSRFNSK